MGRRRVVAASGSLLKKWRRSERLLDGGVVPEGLDVYVISIAVETAEQEPSSGWLCGGDLVEHVIVDDQVNRAAPRRAINWAVQI